MTAPLDLADIAAWVSRPGATPAPAAGDPPTRPGDGPWKPGGPSVTDTHPGGPNTNYARLAVITSNTDELIAGCRATVADVHTTIARHRRAA